MQELIDKLKNVHGLSHEQANGILETIKNFVKEKFPMVGGAIDSVFGSHNLGTDASHSSGSTPTGDTGTTEGSVPKGGSFLDNISEMVPGESGEKAEQLLKDKLGGMFGKKSSE
ncbi:MAG: hypothetical protein M3004_08830 [Bacteroidota bacterium]|nr:hypothetical protein [Bacteroidota bacterium]